MRRSSAGDVPFSTLDVSKEPYASQKHSIDWKNKSTIESGSWQREKVMN